MDLFDKIADTVSVEEVTPLWKNMRIETEKFVNKYGQDFRNPFHLQAMKNLFCSPPFKHPPTVLVFHSYTDQFYPSPS